jgi:prepilin-type N-terminal cleavage/methylation domain-containing protein
MYRKNGLTIIECLLSIIVLAIMLTAGMAFYFNAQASLRWSIHKRIALELAGAELENIKINGYSGLPNPAPVGNLWQGPLAIALGNLSGTKNIYVFDIDDNADNITDYKQVQVVVSWQDAERSVAQSARLDTYIAP